MVQLGSKVKNTGYRPIQAIVSSDSVVCARSPWGGWCVTFIDFSVTDLQSPAQPAKGATILQCRETEPDTALSLSHLSASPPLSKRWKKVFPSLGFLAKSSSFRCYVFLLTVMEDSLGWKSQMTHTDAQWRWSHAVVSHDGSAMKRWICTQQTWRWCGKEMKKAQKEMVMSRSAVRTSPSLFPCISSTKD